MSEQLVDRAREHRSRGAVLKTRLSIIRSRNSSVPVFIYEGDTDVGAYAVWVARIKDELRFEVLVGTGKDQLLDLRRSLKADSAAWAAGVFFFVDRDFDDLKGQEPGPDLFCTDTYSIENYCVEESTLHSLLTDEFRCPGECADRANVIDLFRRVREQAAVSLLEANRRLWRARKLGIRGPGVKDQIAQYLTISLDSVVRKYTDATLATLITLEREPTKEECVDIDKEFATLPPVQRHRGKFLLEFFVRWLEIVAQERKRPGQVLFEKNLDLKFSAQKLSMRVLATHSPIPNGLREVVARAAAFAAQAA